MYTHKSTGTIRITVGLKVTHIMKVKHRDSQQYGCVYYAYINLLHFVCTYICYLYVNAYVCRYCCYKEAL